MLDGCGNVIETWLLEDCWPSEVDFGELDMASSEIAMINLTVEFNWATLNSLDCDVVIPIDCCGCSQTVISVTPLDTLPAFSDSLWYNPILEPSPSSNPPISTVDIPIEIGTGGGINTGNTLYTGNYSYLTVSIGNGLSTPCISFLAQNKSSLGPASNILLNVFISLENGNRIIASKKANEYPAQTNLYTILPDPNTQLCLPLPSPIASYDVNVTVDGQIDSYSS
jgi:hypothetical protein